MIRSKMFGVASFCFAFALFSTFVLTKEIGPFLNMDVLTERQQSGFDGSRELYYGYSSKSKFIVLNDCLNGIYALKSDKAPLRTVRSFAQKCSEVADEIVAVMPTHSHAWLVKASASAELFENKNFNDSLRQSRLTGPNELWIAKMRLDLAERNRTILEPQTVASINGDLVMMAGNQDGSSALAQRYLANPDFRNRIVPLIETLPNGVQSRFIQNIKIEGSKG
jgi:hypothetical protein